jgi:hypothetical protein
MKLKTIVASLLTLGLSGSILSAQAMMMDTSYQMDVMRDQVNKVDMVLNQNQPGGFDQPCGWTCRINISGWMNTDVYLASRPPIFWTVNPNFNASLPIYPGSVIPNSIILPVRNQASDLFLNNANLFVDARVNNWVTAAMSVVYTSFTNIATTGAYAIPNSNFLFQPRNTLTIDTTLGSVKSMYRLANTNRMALSWRIIQPN